MAIIDHANFELEGRKIFAWEYPQKNLSSNTLLNVRQGQEALFMLGGQIKAKYGPNGATPHVLDTGNIPVVRKFFGIPFGGSNPLLASVWFINKADMVNLQVRTDTFLISDPGKEQGFPAIATVTMGLKVIEAEPFFLKLVNGNSRYGESSIISTLQGRITREATEKVSHAATVMQLSAAELNARIGELSRTVQRACTDFIAQWGLEFFDFNIRLEPDTSREGMLMASGYGYDKDSFERQRMLDIQEKAVESMTNGQTGAAGLLVAMSMANSLQRAPQSYAPRAPHTDQKENAQAAKEKPSFKTVFCANCGKKYNTSSSFCYGCGKKYIPCPQCESDTAVDAKRCSNCGYDIKSILKVKCDNCHAEVPEGATFCSHCGRPMNEGRCMGCDTPIKGEKFCPHCGTKNNHIP